MTEAERYDEAWATGEYNPLIGLTYVRCLYRTYFFRGYKTLLDVGCGMGVAVKYHREVGDIEAYGIDFAKSAAEAWKIMGSDKWCSVASAEDIPFPDNSFDMVTCTDMMEHVPRENVKRVLDEMYRVGRQDFYFIIALCEALHKMPQDGTEPHICIEHPQWWTDQIQKAGYRFNTDPYATIKSGKFANLIVDASKRYAYQH